MTQSPQPKFVRETAKALAKLEGKTFVPEHERKDEDLGLNLVIATKACDYVESIAQAIIREQRKKSLTEVQFEPNGYNKFPDLRAIFSNGFKVDFEVKSFYSSNNPVWQGASAKLFTEALLARDPYYFNAWFASFKLSQLSKGYRVDRVEVKRIWEFCPGYIRTGGGASGIAASGQGASSPAAFLTKYIEREVELGRGGQGRARVGCGGHAKDH